MNEFVISARNFSNLHNTLLESQQREIVRTIRRFHLLFRKHIIFICQMSQSYEQVYAKYAKSTIGMLGIHVSPKLHNIT